MAASALAPSLVSHTYSGNAHVQFMVNQQSGELSVVIETDRLSIRSVTEEDLDNFVALFGDPHVMEKFADGTTRTKEQMQTRIRSVWVKRWHDRDPYAGFAVFKKEEPFDFVGHVVLGHGDSPGESEMAYLFHKKYWRKGYGSEAVTALVREYAPATVREGYTTLEGKALTKIVATSRPDNIASQRIVEKIGMKVVREEEKFGALRHHYAIDVSELEKMFTTEPVESKLY